MEKLTPKQIIFCKEYLKDLSPKKAALRAGYSAKTASQIANDLFSKEKIRRRIEEEFRARAEKIQISAEKVLAELVNLMRANIADYFELVEARNDEGQKVKTLRLKDITSLDRSLTARIKDLTIKEGFVKITLYDKLKTIELIQRHIGVKTSLDVTSAGEKITPQNIINIIHRKPEIIDINTKKQA